VNPANNRTFDAWAHIDLPHEWCARPQSEIEAGLESFGAQTAYRRVTSPAIVKHPDRAEYRHTSPVNCNPLTP
jgi:hypothetical protein